MADPPPRPPAGWRTCVSCGDALLAGDARCPTCGSDRVVQEGEVGTLPRSARYRFKALRNLRVLAIVVAILALGYVLVDAVRNGPPTYADPLTTKGAYVIPAGNYTYLSGNVTGEDYIVGNYSVVAPTGAAVGFWIFNTTEFVQFLHHQGSASQWTIAPQTSARIVWAAPYTDLFYLVWANPFPVGSGTNVTVYATTNYMSNIVIG